MRILVTGGTGFIGQRLCRSLVARGHELCVLTRRPHVAEKLLSGSVVLITSLDDIADNEKFDAVINLAGESVAGGRWTERRKQVLFDSRVGVTEALQRLVARLESKPAVLINGSATGFYGDAGNAELTETSPAVKRDFTYLLCDAWEQAARAIGQLGVRVCILRIGVVLSHYGGMLGKLLPVYRTGLGAMMGDGRQWFSWIPDCDHHPLPGLFRRARRLQCRCPATGHLQKIPRSPCVKLPASGLVACPGVTPAAGTRRDVIADARRAEGDPGAANAGRL